MHGTTVEKKTSCVVTFKTLCHMHQENNCLPQINQSWNTESYRQNGDLSFYTIKPVQKKMIGNFKCKIPGFSFKTYSRRSLKNITRCPLKVHATQSNLACLSWGAPTPCINWLLWRTCMSNS